MGGYVHSGHNALHAEGSQAHCCTCLLAAPLDAPVYQAPNVSRGYNDVPPSTMLHRFGQYHSAIGCSFITLWQCAMQLGVNMPTAALLMTGARADRMSAP
mmetsp:Transcript_3217/g.7855  ORF Transcript_3217/g.7855 Transcript_3217/m.7855 type:complete len:100 (-) Transcript_3217:885-1184(-)